MEVVYVSYEEAQRLLPVFEYIAKEGPYREARESAKRILPELRMVRDLDYGPLHGRQIILKREEDRDFLIDAIREAGGK